VLPVLVRLLRQIVDRRRAANTKDTTMPKTGSGELVHRTLPFGFGDSVSFLYEAGVHHMIVALLTMIVPLLRSLRWQRLATAAARFAREQEFHLRRGSYRLDVGEDGIVLVYFGNSPYRAGQQIHAKVLARIQQRLAQMGVKALAHGIWPIHGQQGGCSYAILFNDGSQAMQDVISMVFNEEADRTFREVFELNPRN
jgi:hypothetical protein